MKNSKFKMQNYSRNNLLSIKSKTIFIVIPECCNRKSSVYINRTDTKTTKIILIKSMRPLRLGGLTLNRRAKTLEPFHEIIGG